jgi:hypothetical protein
MGAMMAIMTSFREEGSYPSDRSDVSFLSKIEPGTLDPLNWIRWINPTLLIEEVHPLVLGGNRCEVAYKYKGRVKVSQFTHFKLPKTQEFSDVSARTRSFKTENFKTFPSSPTVVLQVRLNLSFGNLCFVWLPLKCWCLTVVCSSPE